jgi:hypothetical protein
VRALGKEVSDDTKILVPCHNPVDFVNDPAACREGLTADVDSSGKTILDKQGNPILRSRQGDPRHSIVFWVNQQQDAGNQPSERSSHAITSLSVARNSPA